LAAEPLLHRQQGGAGRNLVFGDCFAVLQVREDGISCRFSDI
jgi:hypothetical protein